MPRLLLLLSLATAAQADRIAVLPPTAVNVLPEQAAALAHLVGLEVALLSGDGEIVDPLEVRAANIGRSARAAARALGAERGLHLRLVLGGSRVSATAELLDAEGRQLGDGEIAGLGVDGLGSKARSLARQLLGMEARRTATKRASRADRMAPFRERTYGFNITVLQPLATEGDRSFQRELQMRFDARFEYDRRFLHLGAGLVTATPEDGDTVGQRSFTPAFGIVTSFGYGYAFGDEGFVPYVLGGLQPRFKAYTDNFEEMDWHSLGVAPYLALGIEAGRPAPTRFYMHFEMSQEVFGLAATQSLVFVEPFDDLHPTELGVSVGLGF